ncbi:MAG TPA: hypothetical protein PKY87_13395 [Terricaulis sp.]|nr:hypothetical protein [Terricaulis sp.]
MPTNRLTQEVAEAANAMNRAAERITAKRASEAALQEELSAARATIATLQAQIAAGSPVDADALNALADQLDAAQTNLDQVIDATNGAVDALVEGGADAPAEPEAEAPAAETPAESEPVAEEPVAEAPPVEEAPAVDAPVEEPVAGDATTEPEAP